MFEKSPNQVDVPNYSEIKRFGTETTEQALTRVNAAANRKIKSALWEWESKSPDGQSLSTLDINDFLKSQEFLNAVAGHNDFFKTNQGIDEAVENVRKKYSQIPSDTNDEKVFATNVAPIRSSLNQPPSSRTGGYVGSEQIEAKQETETAPFVTTVDSSLRLETDDEAEARIKAQDIPTVDSSRLEIDKEAEVRVKAQDAKYSVVKSDTNQSGQIVQSVVANDPLFETTEQVSVVEVEKPVALEIPSATQAAENVVSVTEVQGQPLQAEISAQTPREKVTPDLNLRSNEVNVLNIVTSVASIEQFQPIPVQVVEAEKTPISNTEQVPVAELAPEEIVRSREPAVTPEVSLVKAEEVKSGVETNESPAFREALQEFTKSYVTLFKNLRQYNNETLDRKGRETSQSVLFNNDIEDVVAFLSAKNAESGLADEVKNIEKVRVFVVENLFPVKGGMDISSIEGYDFLIDSLSAFERSIRDSYEKTKDLPEAGEFVQILEKVHATFGNLDDMMKRMKQHTLNYLSR